MDSGIVVFISLIYLVLLFVIAIYAQNRSARGLSIVNNPYVYSLSMAVFCTVWTFYGSVGRATQTGLGFSAVYLGPTIAAPLWYMLMRKIILISKHLRITSIADFISSRYGKSTFLGILTTIVLVFGIIPYISIQLKAIGFSFEIMTNTGSNQDFWDGSAFYRDKVNYFTILLAVFTILFGTRHLDPHERHEGLIAAIAFESLIKLISFLLVGVFVVFIAFDGLGDLFSRGWSDPALSRVISLDNSSSGMTSWFWVLVLSAVAAMFLPRQFHVSVVENNNVSFVRQASWMFPLYLFLISIFVIPIALAGKILLPASSDPDMYILSLPLFYGHELLALFVYIGGFSAAASMVVISVISLSIMVSNNLMMPLLLRTRTAKINGFAVLSDRLLGIRRVIIVVILFLAYTFYKVVSNNFPLVSIGLISFAAILQLAPAVIGGLFWPRASKKGAIAGMTAGFIIWFITLPLPTLAESGILDPAIMTDGYFGLSFLKPHALFGIQNVDHISNSCIWSMIFNIGLFGLVSLLSTQDIQELAQGDIYINITKYSDYPDLEVIRKEASVMRLKQLLVRYLGSTRARNLLNAFDGKLSTASDDNASQEFIGFVEKNLTGAFGAASAKLLLSSDIRQQNITLSQLNELINQTKEILEYSQALELRTQELQETSDELAEVNKQLKELDKLKADFISTVTHELRTPITTISSFAQMLDSKANLSEDRKKEYLGIILKECDRIRRLINQVLEVEKIDSVSETREITYTDAVHGIKSAIKRMQPLIEEKNIVLLMSLPDHEVKIKFNDDKFLQVILNLMSNAIKFCDPEKGKISLSLEEFDEKILVKVNNNGAVIPEEFLRRIFEKFTQYKQGNIAKPEGSGLGLYITKKFVEEMGGTVSIESSLNHGTTFSLTLHL